MLTETEKAVFVHNLETSIDWRYPLTSGSDQYDFNSSGNIFMFREGEPVSKQFPAFKIRFLPRMNMVVGGMNNYWYTDNDGWPIYGHGELEPVIMTVYTHQQCQGLTNIYHGKIVADDYIRRTERHIRRYWPKLLWEYDAKIKENISFVVEDISEFIQGTEKQGFEMTLYIVSTNTWDHKPEDANAINTWIDATFSGAEVNMPDETIFSISGLMTR
ncbi:MAG: hypothetical protein FK731_08845 [Asgard group archaeon]|nr:hypothetical protein [Asgard group archaeon]